MNPVQFKVTPVENQAAFAHHPSAQLQTNPAQHQVIPTKEPLTHVPQPRNPLKQGSLVKQPLILPQYRVIPAQPVWLPVAIYQHKVTSANYNVASAQQQVTTGQYQMTSDQVPIWQHGNLVWYPLISAHHQVILVQHSFTHDGEQGNEVWQPLITTQHQVISTEQQVTSDQQQVTSEQQQWALPQHIIQQKQVNKLSQMIDKCCKKEKLLTEKRCVLIFGMVILKTLYINNYPICKKKQYYHLYFQS